MSSILIVEDDDLKLSRVQEFIKGVRPQDEIVTARSYKSGLQALVASPARLVILDMSLPNFDIQAGRDGGRPLSLGGKELLRQIRRRRIEARVIVVTQFDVFGDGPDRLTLDELRGQLAVDYPEHFLGAVFYQSTSDDWKTRLAGLIQTDGGEG